MARTRKLMECRLMQRFARAVALSIVALILLALPAAASARGTWVHPVEQGTVAPRDLAGVRAKREIEDRVLRRTLARASLVQPTRVEEFTDIDHGHSIVIGTAIAGIDLQPYAEILASTIHGDELSDLRVLVIPPSQMDIECGGRPGDGIVACYGADDPERSYGGEMLIPATSPDLVHAVIHEYGHHMDNALANFSGLDTDCGYSDDGSRRWFFARDAYDDLFTNSGCTDDVAYARLLGELFAEDYVALHRIDNWFNSDFPRPTAGMLRALQRDIADRFEPTTYRFRGRLARKGRYRERVYDLKTPTFFWAELVGPAGRRNDFDLYLYKGNSNRAMAKSTRRGSRERIRKVLRPGRYAVGVHSYRGRGTFRIRVDAL
jgi:hypothetical protein